jgi:hypothetical protein
MLRRLTCGAALCAAVCLLPAPALAGYGVQPANGTTTGPKPTFLVYLDPSDSQAQVYVSTSTAATSAGSPVDQIGACTPTTPSVQPNTFTCQPTSYADNGATDSLPPGTYYWWLSVIRTDADHPAGATTMTGPLVFTVSAPTQLTDVFAVSPADGATASATPVLSYHAPAGVTVDVYLAASPNGAADGAPAGPALAHCSITAPATKECSCTVPGSARLRPGTTYYWWLVAAENGSRWVYPARVLTVASAPSGPAPHSVMYAPYLPSSPHYHGKSVKQTRLSKAAYGLSKVLGVPKTVAVACWSSADWQFISGDNPESFYSLLGFWMPAMPRWLELSPGICHTMETLLYNRPRFANGFTANAVDTLTHEMIHALGVRDEAQTECFAMQLSWVSAENLGIPSRYAFSLSRLTLANYPSHPPRYVDRAACRENGAWDLFKGRPSLPWHDFQV